MDEPKSNLSPAVGPTDERRDRNQVLRQIRLALAIDGLGLDERRQPARGVNPYDNGLGGQRQDVWRGRRRG